MSKAKTALGVRKVIEVFRDQEWRHENIPEVHTKLVQELADRIKEGARKDMSPRVEFYNYVILNPLKPGLYRYRLRTGKVVFYKYEPIYVGKGIKGRHRAHAGEARRLLRKLARGEQPRMSAKVKLMVLLQKKGIKPKYVRSDVLVDESTALAIEAIYIDGIGRTSEGVGPLLNRSDGGDGLTSKREQRQIVVKGKSMNLAQWSRETGMKARTIRRRLREGMSCEDAVNPNLRKESFAVLTWKGVTKTLVEWSKELEIDVNSLRGRIKSGKSLKQIMHKGSREARVYITYKGVTRNRTEWAQELGIDVDIIRARQAKGWSIKKIFNTPVQSKAKKVYLTYKGKTLSVAEWSKETGLKVMTIQDRRRKGWPIEKILCPKLNVN